MRVFKYEANSIFGKTSCGVIFADAQEEALKLLKEEFNDEDIKYIKEFPLKKGVGEICIYYD